MGTGLWEFWGDLWEVVAVAGPVSGAQDFLGPFRLTEVTVLLDVPAEPSCLLAKDFLGIGRRLVVGDDFMISWGCLPCGWGSRTCSRTSGLRAPVTI